MWFSIERVPNLFILYAHQALCGDLLITGVMASSCSLALGKIQHTTEQNGLGKMSIALSRTDRLGVYLVRINLWRLFANSSGIDNEFEGIRVLILLHQL